MSSKQQDRLSVLIVSENRITLDEVTEWVAAETDDYDTAISEDRAIWLQKGARYELIVLCFDAIGDSESVRQRIMAEFGEADPPTIVVLCQKSDMKRAYELCDTGIFDNYVLFRPLYDPFRLQLVIREGLRYRRVLKQANAVRTDIREMAAGVQRLSGLSDKLHKQSQKLGDRARNQMKEIGGEIGVSLDQVRQVIQERQETSKDAAWLGELEQQLCAVRDDVVDQKLSEAGKNLNEWVVEIAGQHNKSSGAILGELDATGSDALRRGSTVLVVEDEPLTLQTIAQILLNQEYEVLLARNGAEGIRQAVSHRPNAILLDVMLPDLTGDKVIEKLRADKRTRDIPVIVLSAVADKRVVVNLIKLGVAGYQIKPPAKKQLLQQLEDVLAEH